MTAKFALVLAILLLVLSLAGITTAAVVINAARDQVELGERVLVGDPAILRGLSVRLRNTYGHRLFWDTAYTPADGSAETEFDFAAVRRGERGEEVFGGVELFNGLHYGYSLIGSRYDDEEQAQEKTGLLGAYNQLYRDTPNGEKRSMTVDLADYYDYYPITGTISLPGFSRTMEWENAHLNYTPTKDSRLYTGWRLNDYFKIPMLPDQKVEIRIDKSRDGLSVSIGATTDWSDKEVERYELSSYSAVAADACYFTINALTSMNNPIDVSQIEGGYGIYRLPISGGYTDVDTLQNVYPLDPVDGGILALLLSPDQTKLLLYRRQGDALTLTVIDRASMQTLQSLNMGGPSPSEDSWSFSFHDGGDYHLICLDRARLLLVEADAAGSYYVGLDVPVDSASLGLAWDDKAATYLRWLNPTMTSAWDGTRLVMADSMSQHGGYDKYLNACDFYLAVFTAEGLQYFGIHETSLNADNDQRSTSSCCWPMDYDPIQLSWGTVS